MTNNNKRWITRHKFWEKKRELRDINRIASLNCEIKMQLSLYLFNFIVFYFSRWKQISLVHMYIFHLNLNYCFISYIYKGVNIKHCIKHSACNVFYERSCPWCWNVLLILKFNVLVYYRLVLINKPSVLETAYQKC